MHLAFNTFKYWIVYLNHRSNYVRKYDNLRRDYIDSYIVLLRCYANYIVVTAILLSFSTKKFNTPAAFVN